MPMMGSWWVTRQPELSPMRGAARKACVMVLVMIRMVMAGMVMV